MLIPYMPLPEIRRILHERARLLAKSCRLYTLFAYDPDTSIIYVYTERPGLWIGFQGKDIADLTKRCNDKISNYNERHPDAPKKYIEIKLIECVY